MHFDTLKDNSSRSYLGALAPASVLAVIIAMTFLARPEPRGLFWLMNMILFLIFILIIGRQVTGYWRGIFIDGRNKISLSRFQMIAWTVMILSALFTAMLSNTATGNPGESSLLNIEVPSEIWALLGISTISSVIAPALLETNRESRVLDTNTTSNEARWVDLIMGEEEENANQLDLGKLQMFLFTFILVIGYGSAIALNFSGQDQINSLPEVSRGIDVLLAISHTGYLANKIPTKTSPKKTPNA